MKNLILFATILLITACVQGNSQSSQVLSANDYEKKLATTPDKLLIDVRTADEYSKGHLAGAALLDLYRKDFKDQLAKLDKKKTVFVYCAGGGRGDSASELLEELGFKQIYNLKGGLNAWTKAGKPIAK